jgi:hypothetical protein
MMTVPSLYDRRLRCRFEIIWRCCANPTCLGAFRRQVWAGKTGRKQVYCSDRCRRAAISRRARETEK